MSQAIDIDPFESVTDYFQCFGSALSQRVQERTKALHVVGRDTLPDMSEFLRAPMEAQAHVIAAGVKALQQEKTLWLNCEMGTGKAQPLDAKVLTPTGYKRMGELRIGDEVVDPDGGIGHVTGIFPQGIKEVFKVGFSDGAEVECCDDHLWTYRTPVDANTGRPWRTEPLRELKKKLWGGCKNSSGKPNARVFIPMMVAPDLVGPELPLDPYVFGVLLGDGCLKSTPRFWTLDEEIVAAVEKRIPETCKVKRMSDGRRCPTYSIKAKTQRIRNEVLCAIETMNLRGSRSHMKMIPREYFLTTAENRLELLRGLMDTDGYAAKNGTSSFSSTSLRLVLQVQQLVESLGGVGRISTKRDRTYRYKGEMRPCRDAHTVHMKLPFNPFNLTRKVARTNHARKYPASRAMVSVEHSRTCECQCISVSTKRNLYVTNRYIVTHNTFLAIATAHEHAKGKPYRAIVVCPPHLKAKWVRELEITIPGVSAQAITRYREFSQLARTREQPLGAEWYVISESGAKLGQPWKSVTEPLPHMGRYALYEVVHDFRRVPTRYDRKKRCCPRCKELIQRKTGPASERAYTIEEIEKRKMFCEKCGEALWTWTNQYDRWPIARFVAKKMRGVFDYLVVDEMHVARGDSTAIANSVGKLASACKKVIGLTGTLLGGYATDIFGLLWRLSPDTLLEDDVAFGQEEKFAEVYGRVETTITKKITKKERFSNKQSQGSAGSKKTRVRPGIMPTLFSKHLMNKTIFLRLDELAANLPAIDEQVICIDMDSDQASVYADLEEAMRSHFRDLLQTPNGIQAVRKLMISLLGYIDRPWDWGDIGYYDPEGQWVDVFSPPDLAKSVVRPKEQAIVDFVREEMEANRKTWVFCQMTKTRDVQPRLAELLQAQGVRVRILRSDTVPTDKREDWIGKNGPQADVIISHPMLVQTGLEFFDRKKTYNFSSIAWYQTGYSLYTLRQASRRHWRIGQDQLCKIRYFGYSRTMQQNCMNLMSAKLNASQQLEGKLDTNGLAALAAEMDSVEIALAKTLTEKLAGTVSVRNWELSSAS